MQYLLNIFKNKNNIVNFLKSIVFFSVFALVLINNNNKKNILILHSFDPDNENVKDFNNGFNKAISKDINLKITYFYLNSLYFQSQENKQANINKVIENIKKEKPEFLITVGNEALNLVAPKFKNKKTTIIATCIKELNKDIGFQAKKDIGLIIESGQIDQINKLLNRMFGKKNNIKIGFVGDNSQNSNYMQKAIINFNWDNCSIEYCAQSNGLDNFYQICEKISNKCDVLLLGSYKEVRIFDEQNIMDEIKNKTNIPIVSTNAYAVKEGADIAIIDSWFEQGNLSGEAISKIITDKKTNKAIDMPYIKTNFFTVHVNLDKNRQKNIFQKLNIEIPELYQSFAYGINSLYKPFH